MEPPPKENMLGLSADKDKSVRSIVVQCSAAKLLGSSIIKRNSVHCRFSDAAAGFSIERDGNIKHIPMVPERK